MCGIAGFFQRDGAPASAADARAMVDAMPHRGPDGRGAWSSGPVAIAHGRLAVRDRSEVAAQPMHARGGEGVLVYNGEVYNDGEIRADLAREGVTVEGSGDARVVLHAIAQWGVEAAVARFDGMFALAWWDARERVLSLARDRFGTKPLHFAATPDRVAFASEVRGLAALAGRALDADPVEIVRRVLVPSIDELRPPFRGVENVRPGELLRVSTAGVESRTWCDLLAEVDVDRILAARREPSAAWERRTEDAVAAATRSHLASDVPVAVFTSGGVDSNLIASYVHETRPDVVAYTVDTAHPESEIAAAREMAARTGVELRVVRVDRDTYLRTWPATVEALEHTPANGSAPAALALSRAARADGIVVALTGEGADEIFGGYDFLRRTHHQWRRATRPWSRWTHAGRAAARDLADVPFRYQSIRREADTHRRLEAALLPGEEARARALMKKLARIEPASDRAFVAHSLDTLRRHLGWILLRHDRIGMASSIEERVPFLSNRVADVGLHLPVKAKLHGRVGKWVLKRVAARRLPARLVFARKKGFPIPASHHQGTTRLLVGGLVPDLLRWPRDGRADLLARIEADVVLRPQIVALELWAQIFLAGARADDLADRLLAASAPS